MSNLQRLCHKDICIYGKNIIDKTGIVDIMVNIRIIYYINVLMRKR